jgi:hypothetical protein
VGPEPEQEVLGVGDPDAVHQRCGVGREEESSRPGDPFCCRLLLEHGLREDVQAELVVGVGAGVEDLVVNRGVRDRGKDRAAGGGVSRTRANDIGMRDAGDDGTRVERDVFVTSNGPQAPRGGPRESGSLCDEGRGKPKEKSCALRCVLGDLSEKAQ